MFSLTQPDRKMGADGHDSENKLVAESTQLLIAWKTEVPKKAENTSKVGLANLGPTASLGPDLLHRSVGKKREQLGNAELARCPPLGWLFDHFLVPALNCWQGFGTSEHKGLKNLRLEPSSSCCYSHHQSIQLPRWDCHFLSPGRSRSEP